LPPGQPRPRGTAAQRPGQRLTQLALRRALEDPGHLGEQIGSAGRELAQRGHRGSLLVCGEVLPPGAVPGLTCQLRDEDPVSIRPFIERAFYYR
jgi:hypothetical protein